MRLKAVSFLLLLTLVFSNPLSSFSNNRWSEDPIFWGSVALVGGAAYLVRGRLLDGFMKVLPYLPGSQVAATVIGTFFLSKQNGIIAILPALSLIVFVLYKSLKTCPQTGTPGCCCGMKPAGT